MDLDEDQLVIIPELRIKPGTLAERRIAWARRESERAPFPGVMTVNSWFALCKRVQRDGSEAPIGITFAHAPNFCAAAVAASMMFTLLHGDVLPHGPRAGVREMIPDAIAAGTWVPATALPPAAGAPGWLPVPGDVIVQARGLPSRGLGHTGLVDEVRPEGCMRLGANEVVRPGPDGWKCSLLKWGDPSWLGIIANDAARAAKAIA